MRADETSFQDENLEHWHDALPPQTQSAQVISTRSYGIMDGCLKCGPAALQRILRRTPLCQKSESPCEPVALKSKQCTNVLALSSLLSPSFPRPFTQTHLSNTYTYNSAPTTTRRGREYRRVCHGRESRRVIVAMLTVGALVLVRLGGGWGGVALVPPDA